LASSERATLLLRHWLFNLQRHLSQSQSSTKRKELHHRSAELNLNNPVIAYFEFSSPHIPLLPHLTSLDVLIPTLSQIIPPHIRKRQNGFQSN